MNQPNTNAKLYNMTLFGKGSQSIVFKVLIWFTLLNYALACFMSFYKKAVYADFLINYIWILALAVMVICLCKGFYFQRKIYLICCIFVLWMIMTFFMKGNAPLADPTNHTFLISRSTLCCIAFPFVYIMNDAQERKSLHTLLYIFVSVTAVLLWLSYIGILRGDSICLFNGRFMFGATYTYTDRMMLQFFNLYYYKTGYLALIGFFVTLYLAISHWTKHNCIYYVLLMVTFTIAIIITYSRTAVFTFVIGLLIALLIVLQHLNIRTRTRRIIMTISSFSGIIIAAVGLNITYKVFNSIRDIWYGIDTLSSRTDIWSSIIDVTHDMPEILLHGLPIRESMTIMNSYIDLADKVSNMHSGYLQTLVLVGIPGLIAIIAFCIYLLLAMKRIVFSSSNNSRETLSKKFMIIVPLCLLIMNLFESLIFFNPVQTDLFNFIFALFTGYIIEYAYHQN